MAEKLLISKITVGERRRESYGDIDGLAESIKRYGLIHPIVVDDAGNLVAGERRLRACGKLGWKEVPVRSMGELTPIELREIELEENLRRKDLTAAERSRLMVEFVEAAEQAAKEEAKREAEEEVAIAARVTEKAKNGKATGFSAQDVQKRNPGRPKGKKAGSGPDVQERTGINRETARKAKQHVNAFSRYPFLERPHWNQSSAIEAFKALESLPEEERDRAGAMIDQPAIPPANAITMLRTLAGMSAKNREAVLSDYESGDESRKQNAVCCAAQQPPMPDPRITENESILRAIAKAEKFGAAKEYVAARDAINSLQEKLRKAYERDAESLARRRGA